MMVRAERRGQASQAPGLLITPTKLAGAQPPTRAQPRNISELNLEHHDHINHLCVPLKSPSF